MHDYTHVLLTSFYSAVIVLGQAFDAKFSGIVGWTTAKALIILGFLKIPKRSYLKMFVPTLLVLYGVANYSCVPAHESPSPINYIPIQSF